jgi:signal transduction histidine kinase
MDQDRVAVSRVPRARPAIAVLTVVATVTVHVLLLLLFEFGSGIVVTWDLRYHIYALSGVAVVLSIGVFATRRRSIFLILVAVRLAVLMIIGVRFPGVFAIRFGLLVPLILELAVYERYPGNAILAGVAAATTACVYFLSDGGSGAALVESVLLLALAAIVGACSTTVAHFRERMVSETEQRTRLDQIVQELTASNVRLQQLAFRAGEESKEAERNRITSEIHDAVGYTLTNLIMMMEAATDIVHDDPVRLGRLMQSARDQAKSGLEETRRALRVLRAQEEQPLRGVQAYERLFRTFARASSIKINAQYGNIPISLGEEVDSVVYHFVQEGLTNAVRHGRADQVSIVFWLSDGRLSITMIDNGVGAKEIAPGIGLSGMKERAARLEGSVVARPLPHGFELQMELLLPDTYHGQNARRTG